MVLMTSGHHDNTAAMVAEKTIGSFFKWIISGHWTLFLELRTSCERTCSLQTPFSQQ
jgi:hypothetical protein